MQSGVPVRDLGFVLLMLRKNGMITVAGRKLWLSPIAKSVSMKKQMNTKDSCRLAASRSSREGLCPSLLGRL